MRGESEGLASRSGHATLLRRCRNPSMPDNGSRAVRGARAAAALAAVIAAGLAACKSYTAIPYDAGRESINVETPDGNGTGDRPAMDVPSSNVADASDAGDATGGSAVLTINSSAHDFGMVVTGTTSADATFVVMNTGGAASASLSAALSDAAKTAGFSIKTDHCSGMSLGGGASCQIVVVLMPAAAGAPSSTLHQRRTDWAPSAMR